MNTLEQITTRERAIIAQQYLLNFYKNGEISEDDFFEMLPNKGEIDDINILPTKEEWEKNYY